MATRPTWQGHLRLSLVSCPVALYTATSRTGEVHFNMLEKSTHERMNVVANMPSAARNSCAEKLGASARRGNSMAALSRIGRMTAGPRLRG